MSDTTETVAQKPILCIDYEGTVCTKDEKPTEGFFTWAVEACRHFNLVIFTPQASTEEGLQSLEQWLQLHTIAWRHDQMERGTPIATAPLAFEFAHEKLPAFLTIDDRSITFTGRWTDLKLKPETLLKFIAWTDPAFEAQDEIRSNVVAPPNAKNTCPRHPWMTYQDKNGSRHCTAAGCEWRG
jgi:hypothetical protein